VANVPNALRILGSLSTLGPLGMIGGEAIALANRHHQAPLLLSLYCAVVSVRLVRRATKSRLLRPLSSCSAYSLRQQRASAMPIPTPQLEGGSSSACFILVVSTSAFFLRQRRARPARAMSVRLLAPSRLLRTLRLPITL
jgi:hypothetical protein